MALVEATHIFEIARAAHDGFAVLGALFSLQRDARPVEARRMLGRDAVEFHAMGLAVGEPAFTEGGVAVRIGRRRHYQSELVIDAGSHAIVGRAQLAPALFAPALKTLALVDAAQNRGFASPPGRGGDAVGNPSAVDLAVEWFLDCIRRMRIRQRQ